MRLLPYFILAYVMLGLQAGVSRYIEFHGAAPNLGLLAVLFIALNASRNAALLGSISIGFLQDLLTMQQPGLYVFSYGLIGILAVAVHHLVNRNHALTHFALALAGGLITMCVLLLHSWIHPAGPAVLSEGKIIFRAIRIPAFVEFTRVIYTAMLAPAVLWALGRIRNIFAFQPGRAGR